MPKWKNFPKLLQKSHKETLFPEVSTGVNEKSSEFFQNSHNMKSWRLFTLLLVDKSAFIYFHINSKDG